MSVPWFPFTERELALLKRCRSIKEQVVLAASLLLGANVRDEAPLVSFSRPMRKHEVDELSGYSERHVRIAFAELELSVGLRRNFGRKSRKDRTAEFQLELPFDPLADHGSHTGMIENGSRIDGDPSSELDTRARARAPDHPPPDPSSDPDPEPDPCSEIPTDRAVRTVPLRSNGRTARAARVVRLDGPLEKLTWKLFPSQHRPYAREYLAAMRLDANDKTIARFLRWLADERQDERFRGAKQRLAVALSSGAWQEWLASVDEREAAPEPTKDVEFWRDVAAQLRKGGAK